MTAEHGTAGRFRRQFALLNEGGCIYIGDVAFETRVELQKCMAEAGDEWDDDEIYFVYDELRAHFPTMKSLDK